MGSGEGDGGDGAGFAFDAKAGVLEEGADAGGGGGGDEGGEELGQGDQGPATLFRVGDGGEEGGDVFAFLAQGGDVGEKGVVGGTVDLRVHLAGGEDEGQALAALGQVAEATLDPGEVVAELGGVVGAGQDAVEDVWIGELLEEAGEGVYDGGLLDVVLVAGLAGDGLAVVLRTAQGVGLATVEMAGHGAAAAGTEDDAGEGRACTPLVGVATALALADDGGVGVEVPERGIVGGGFGGGDVAPPREAGVVVVVEDVPDGGVVPAFGAGRVVRRSIEGVDDGGVGLAGEELSGGQGDGGGKVGVELCAGGDAGDGVPGGQVAEGPVVGGEASAHAGGDTVTHALDAEVLVLLGADGLDGVDVAVAGGGVADGVRCAGQVNLGAGLLHQAEDLVGEGGIAAQTVGVDGKEDVEGVFLAILAELAVGGHGGLGVRPEDEITGVAGDGVDADDVGTYSVGELAAGGLLVVEGRFILGGLGFGRDGTPDGDAEGGWGFGFHVSGWDQSQSWS